MGIVFNPNRFGIGLHPVQLNNNGSVNFGNTYSDKFQNNSVDNFFDETAVKYLINSNPQVKKILNENNIPLRINLLDLYTLKVNHCTQTRDIADQIAKNLLPALRQMVDIKDLKDAAMLHDFGKVLIPDEILSKPSTLTPYERKIMDLHSELGYQLLKNSGVNQHVLNLVRYHHNIENSPSVDINFDILNLADKYCALTEKRVYKDAMSPRQALTILSKDVRTGEINPYIFNALVKSVSKQIVKQNVKIS